MTWPSCSSSFLMGKSLPTIFKQMYDNSAKRFSREGFKNIGRDEGRHMAICMAVMGATTRA